MAADQDVGSLPTVLQSGDHGGEAPSDRLTPGACAGDYVIERLLGAGAMGEVYAGHHPAIGKKVAIKVLRRQLASSAEAVERLMREARAVNQVDHPNVVDVFALGRLDDGRLYLVTDLVEGESLRARVARGPLAPAVALAVLEPIAAALDAAHAKGIIHRDLKPDNVMLSGSPDRPRVYVIDFGIAKLVSSVASDDVRAQFATLTAQGTWLGTPAYMAPEQWSADGAVPASDRYAFAVMTYELLAGSPPFAAPNVPGLMEKHFRADVPPLSTGAGAALPAAVDTVLGRGMAKDPDARFATASELVDALRDALGTQVGAAPGRAAAKATTAGATGKRTPLPLVAGTVGIAVTALGVWIVMRDRGAGSAAASEREQGSGLAVEITSTPNGATIVRDGVEVAVTPRAIPLGTKPIVIEVRKAGYLPEKRTLGPRDTTTLALHLQPVDGFQGTWVLKSGELRRFVRDGDAVVALRLAAVSEPGTFYRRFHFVPATGATVSFAAEENHTDTRAPSEPTCNVPLQAQYDYDAGGDELELRKERIKLAYENGKCVVIAREWADPEALSRVDHAATAGDWEESRAGGMATVNADRGEGQADLVDNPGFTPKEPLADDEKKAPDAAKKAPAKAPAKTPPKRKVAPPPNKDAKQLDELDAKTRGTVRGEQQKLPPPPQEQQQQAPGPQAQFPPNAQIAPQPQASPKPDSTEEPVLQQKAGPIRKK